MGSPGNASATVSRGGGVGGSTPLNTGNGWIRRSPVASVHTSAITERPRSSTIQVSRRRSPHRVHASLIQRCARLVTVAP